MLQAIYHPVLPMQAVDEEFAKRLIESGAWFAHPSDAKRVRSNYERHTETKLECGNSDLQPAETKSARQEIVSGNDQRREAIKRPRVKVGKRLGRDVRQLKSEDISDGAAGEDSK